MTAPLTAQQEAGIARAGRKFKRDMDALVGDVVSGVDSVSMRVGNGEPIEIASRREEAEPNEVGQVIQMRVLPAFLQAGEVERICRDLIDEFESFHPLADKKLDFWFDTKIPTNRGGCQTIGRAHVVNPLWNAISGWDGLIVVNGPWWASADENSRRALCYHELCHFAVDDETDALTTVKHDLEAFVGEARHFGAWRRAIGELAEQLSLFEG